MPGEKLAVGNDADVDLGHRAFGLRGRRTELGRERFINSAAVHYAAACATGHRSGRNDCVRQPVDDRRVRAGDIVAGPLDSEEFAAVPDDPRRHSVRYDDSYPGVLIVGQRALVRDYATACEIAGRIEKPAVGRELQLEAPAQRIEAHLDGTHRADLLAAVDAGAADAQALQRFMVGKRDRGGLCRHRNAQYCPSS